MFREIDTKRIKQIYLLLAEMAEGRFGKQIERSGEDDDIEKVIVLVNMMSEEMQQTLSFYSVLHTPDSFENDVKNAIILDQNNRIMSMNRFARETLLSGSLPKERLPFTSLLSNSSLDLWKAIAEQIKFENEYEGTHTLVFKCPSGLNQKINCSIYTTMDDQIWKKYTYITSYESQRSSILLEDELRLKKQKGENRETIYDKQHVLKSFQDTQILQDVNFYILKNIDKPIPPQKELARMFGINENKLKYGFKQLYYTSINRFITAERLKIAALLIQFTDQDMKSIGKSCGFKSLQHFSKAFKERYGYSPIMLRRYIKKREKEDEN